MTDADTELLALAARSRAQLTGPGAPFELHTVDVGGTAMAAYRHAFATLPALLEAGRAHGDREFLVFDEERWTFAQFFRAVDALAARLQVINGLQPGERVALAMRNRPQWAVAFVAVALTGAVPAPLNSFGLREELLSGLQSLQARLLIADYDRLAHIQDDLPALQLPCLCVDDAQGQPSRAWQDATAAGGPSSTAPVLNTLDPALILFTSGASSQAKGVVSSHRALCQALFNIDFIGAMSAMTSPDIVAAMMARALPPTTLTAVPLFHVSGLHAQLLTALRHGRRLVFMRRWNPQQALALIQKERITQFNGAPSMVMQLLAEPGFDDPAVTGTLGGLGFGGAGLPQSLVQDVLVRRPHSMSGIGFGLTETNGAGAAISGRMFVLRPQAAGQLSPIISLRIVDAQGADLPLGEAGEIWLRGVSLMEGYWHADPAQRTPLADQWFQTGDIGVLDAEGYLRVVDRIKDVINRAGEKIASAEVESCLLAHPQVVEAAVFAQPDAHTGEAVVAVVVPLAGAALSAEHIQAHVAAHLAAYKVPQRVVLRTEPLPRNPAGKTLKPALRTQYAA
jgi:long-chain acyl-CoA synthetase